jgi:hypothetical protein
MSECCHKNSQITASFLHPIITKKYTFNFLEDKRRKLFETNAWIRENDVITIAVVAFFALAVFSY